LAAELLDVVILGAEALRLRLNAVVRTESLDVEHLGEVCRRNIAAHLAAAGLAADLPDRELGVGATTCSGSLLARAPVSGQLGGVILDALEGLGKLPPDDPGVVTRGLGGLAVCVLALLQVLHQVVHELLPLLGRLGHREIAAGALVRADAKAACDDVLETFESEALSSVPSAIGGKQQHGCADQEHQAHASRHASAQHAAC
jgi:hypothetical protein